MIDLNGTRLAYGTNPSTRGQNIYEMRDADGRAFIPGMIEGAKTRGRGWVDYRWLNHANGKMEMKSVYYELVDNIIVACGIYKEAASAQPEPGYARSEFALSGTKLLSNAAARGA